MVIAPELEELEAKSQALDLLMTEEDLRDRVEYALKRAVDARVWELDA